MDFDIGLFQVYKGKFITTVVAIKRLHRSDDDIVKDFLHEVGPVPSLCRFMCCLQRREYIFNQLIYPFLLPAGGNNEVRSTPWPTIKLHYFKAGKLS